jgi:hypothetical protein
MKTATEWFKEGRSKTRNYDESVAFLKQIQLDAWQQGMTDAAEIAEDSAESVCDISACAIARRAIMDKIKTVAAMPNVES